MKSIFYFTLSLILLNFGCTKNEVTLINSTNEVITTHFRGERYQLAPTASTTIENIPDGEYSYEASATKPISADSIVASGMSGTFNFSEFETQTSLEFFSNIDTLTTDTSSLIIYSIYSIQSSSQSSSGY